MQRFFGWVGGGSSATADEDSIDKQTLISGSGNDEDDYDEDNADDIYDSDDDDDDEEDESDGSNEGGTGEVSVVENNGDGAAVEEHDAEENENDPDKLDGQQPGESFQPEEVDNTAEETEKAEEDIITTQQESITESESDNLQSKNKVFENPEQHTNGNSSLEGVGRQETVSEDGSPSSQEIIDINGVEDEMSQNKDEVNKSDSLIDKSSLDEEPKSNGEIQHKQNEDGAPLDQPGMNSENDKVGEEKKASPLQSSIPSAEEVSSSAAAATQDELHMNSDNDTVEEEVDISPFQYDTSMSSKGEDAKAGHDDSSLKADITKAVTADEADEVKDFTFEEADEEIKEVTSKSEEPASSDTPGIGKSDTVETASQHDQEEENEEDIHDSFPRARDFLADVMDNASLLTTNQAATEIVEGFNYDDDDNNHHGDSKTLTTHRTSGTQRTSGTRVQPVSAAFRSAMLAQKEGDQERHPHQSIFDILDRNFEELGDGNKGVGYADVKLCFVAFVAVFSLPEEPVFAHEALDDAMREYSDQADDDSEDGPRPNVNTKKKSKEIVLQKVPLSVAFALWNIVLQKSNGGRSKKKSSTEQMSYIRSTLVLLGMLDLASIDVDRGDGAGTLSLSMKLSNKKSIECLVVHDHIHQQYGEYLAWGEHAEAFRSLIERHGQRWNGAAMKESKLIGSNEYTLRMLPMNTIRAHRMQEAFNILNEKTFVRRRIRVLGAQGAAKAHVGDIDELLGIIEQQITNDDPLTEEIDQQEGMMGAYQQILKYCLHETEELVKPHKDEEGNTKLGKTAMYKTAEIGNAIHLLGASLGGYGFYDEEMEYYKEALRIKKLSVNGEIEKSVSASDTLHNMGFSLDNLGKSDEALEFYDQALLIRYDCLGEDDLRVAETHHNKGALLCEEDRADEAMECLEEALRIREIHYGEEHESCADTMQWMGNLLRKHGDPSEALDYFKFALSIKQNRLGNDDIDVANTLFNTAVLLDDIEKYDLSLVAYQEALRIRKLVLGDNNQEIADTLLCIGNVATVVESHEEALECYKESMTIREALIRESDPCAETIDDSLLFISNPISLNEDLHAQYDSLSQCCEEALPLTKLIQGGNHPDVCTLLNRMGEIYKKLYDWDNAIGSYQGALRVKRGDAPEGGDDDLAVATLLLRKGEAHLYKNEFDRARVTFDSAMQISKNMSGDNSTHVASSTYCLGVAYHYLGDFAQAKLLFQECIRIQVKLASGDNSNVVRTLCWIGKLHEKLKEPAKALERYLYALKVYKNEKSGIDYRIVAMLLHSIGGLYENDKIDLQEMAVKCYNEEIALINSKLDVDEMQTIATLAEAHYRPGMLHKQREEVDNAIEHLEKALELYEHASDADIDEKLATISDNLGMLYVSRKEYEVAKKHYSSAYSFYENCIGREDMLTADCAYRLGKVLEELESDLAEEFYTESLRVHRLNMVEDDERVGELLFCLGGISLAKGAGDDAVKHFEEALGIRKRLLGDCSDVADTYHNLGNAYSEILQEEKSLIFYKESVRINKKIGEKDALYKVSMDMAQLATSLAESNTDDNNRPNYEMAISCYNDCLEATESMDINDNETALVMQHMGEIHYKLNNFEDATKLLLDALELLRSSVDSDGSNHEQTIGLVLLIAQAYTSAKNYKSALDYYKDHIKLLESKVSEGSDVDDDIANSLLAMGNMLAERDDRPDFDAAIEKLVECVDIKKDIYGPEDEQVADAVYKLSAVYEKAEHHNKATESLAEALRIYKMKQNKVGTVKVYHSLARLHSTNATETSGRNAAIECYEEALKIRRQMMSLDDIELATMLYEYATLLCLEEEHETALPLLAEALRIQKSKNGLMHESTVNTILKIAEAQVYLEKFDASLVSLEQVLFIQSNLGEEVEIDHGTFHYLLGTTYLARGESQKAIDAYLESMKRKQEEYSTDSLECAAVSNELGTAYRQVGDFDKATESLVSALRIRKKELGSDSLDYGHSVENLAHIHIAKAKHNQALNCLTEATRVYELFLGDVGEEKMAELLEHKGDAQYELEDFEQSLATFQECLELLDPNVNDESDSQGPSNAYDERTARVHYKMGRVYSKLDDSDGAFESFREAITIYSIVLGKDDLHVGEVMYDVGHLNASQGSEDNADESMECFNEVIRIYRLHGQEKDAKVADALIQKSSLLLDCEECDEAASLLDDAIAIYKELKSNDAVEIGKAMLLYGRLHESQGKDDESLQAFNEALRIYQLAHGKHGTNANVSIALSNIGILYARKGEFKIAVEKQKQALKNYVAIGGQDHDVADSVFNLANILYDSGEVGEAYKYFKQVLKLYTNLLGENDISVAKVQQKLGELYWKRKEVSQSLQSFLHALRICEQEEADDLSEMLASIHRGIADCYYSKGDESRAKDHFAHCLKELKNEFGDNCLEMAEPCHFIGLIYQKDERHEEAMNFHAKALAIYENHYGKGSKECAKSNFQVGKMFLALHKYEECVTQLVNHLETYCQETEFKELAEVYHPLGLAQSKLELYGDSVTSLTKAVTIRSKVLGKIDPKVAETMLDLAKVLEDCGDSDEAISVYDQAITILHQIDHSDIHVIASAYSRLGTLLQEEGRIESSLHSWKKALKIFTTNLGRDDILVGEVLFQIGLIYDTLGNHDKASSCFSETIKIYRAKGKGDGLLDRFGGRDTQREDDNGVDQLAFQIVGQSLGHIGRNYARKKQYSKAVELCTEELQYRKKFAQAEDIAQSIVELGNILKAWGKTEQSLQFFEEALRTYQEARGIDCVEVANCKHSIGILNKQLGKTEKALKCFGEALRIHRVEEGDKSLSVADNLFQIGQIFDSFGKKEQSLKCFEECLSIRKETLGEDHLDVLAAQRYVSHFINT